jgi:hypothetical protein
MLASRSRRPNASLGWQPSPEWCTSPLLGRRFHTAMLNASKTSSVRKCVCHRPVDDAATERVEDDREIQPAFVGPALRDIRDPQSIRSDRPEVALDEIRGRHCVRVAVCETASFASMAALDAGDAHQPSDTFTTATDVVVKV